MMGPGMWLMVAAVASTVPGGVMEAGEGVNSADTQYCDLVPDQPDPPPQPVMAEQYTTRLEAVRIADKGITLVDYAQYEYDGPGNKVAVKFYSKYHHTSYILNWSTGQMLKLVVPKHGQEMRECIVRLLEEGTTLFPVLVGAGQNLSTETIIDPGVILGVLDWSQTNYKGKYDHRGMPAERWDWCGLTAFEQDAGNSNVTMATYWSATSWKMPIPESQVISFPLGWEVVEWPSDSRSLREPAMIKPQVHNILYYRPGEVDTEAFLIPTEMYCSGLVAEEGHPFPDFGKDRLFTFSMEVRMPRANVLSWADGWYDFEKQLYRIDHDVISTPRETITTSEIFDYNDGLSFTMIWNMGPGDDCKVNVINDTRTDWSDITGMGHLWADSPNAFFGSDITNYTYYGPGVTRYVVGKEWRGQRTDWPSTTDDNTHTLWQWTFSNKNVSTLTSMGDHLYIERQVPIGLKVTALHDISTSEGLFPQGSSYDYQLYNFDLEVETKEDLYSDAGVFDTYQCYSANWRDHLMFKLDVSSWPDVVWTPLFTSVWLREYWQKLLAEKGTVSPIRITRVKTISEENGSTWVDFVLLYRHPMISQLDPDLYRQMTPGEEAYKLISKAINNGEVSFHGKQPDNGNDFDLTAVPDSLTQVLEPDCSSTTTTTLPHKTTTTTSTTTENPDKVTTSSSITTEDPDNPNPKPYSSGDLAGLGVGMLLIGMAFGAGGTFLVVVKQCHYTVMGWCGKS